MTSPERDFFDSVLLVLVLFEKPLDDSSSFLSLDKARENASTPLTLFIYDNSSSARNYPARRGWDIHYRHDPSNPGVSKAYNEANRLAQSLKKTRLLLLDQDSEFPADIFSTLARAVDEHGGSPVIVPVMQDRSGILSPFRFKMGRGKRIRNLSPGFKEMRHLKFINSGALISREAFERAGGYDERFPLDFSDIVFQEKIKKIAPRFFVIDLKGNHSLSDVSRVPKQGIISRFGIYCEAANLFSKTYGGRWVLLVKWIRSVKLSITHGDWIFITLAMKS
jgi:rhamnosyltransferase